MNRVAPIVVSGFPHHITQRGNRQADLFERSDDQSYSSINPDGASCGSEPFLEQLERVLNRSVCRKKPGRKPGKQN
ncbi:MAG: hypothetical protein KAH38_02805 [Candidatus Hydrogenedentes bacterium]|nr:hypothetical protein [Candidatus Hydrogenedentota bacterium]